MRRFRKSFTTTRAAKVPLSYQVVFPLESDQVQLKRFIPSHIIKPEYATTGKTYRSTTVVDIKSEEQIAAIQIPCRIAKQVLINLEKYITVSELLIMLF